MSDRRRRASDIDAEERHRKYTGDTAYGTTVAHGSDFSNPHGVTLEQARTKGDTFSGAVKFTNDGIYILDTDASHFLIVKAGSDLTADRIITFTTDDAARTLTINGDPTLADWFDQSVKQAASPTFAGLTVSGLTASRLLATNGSKGLASVADLASWIAGTANQIVVTADGDGSVTLSLSSTLVAPGSLTVTGNIYQTDSIKHIFGTGSDAEIYYDGTDLKIVTDIVAPSDLVLDCGTDKTLELAETVWDDLRVNPSTVRLPGTNPPTIQAYKGSTVLSFEDAGGDDTISFNVQLPHNYKEGTDVKFHVHWTIDTSGAGAGAENMKWDFTYSWANANSSFPAESSGTVTVDVQNDTADDHMIDGVVTMTGAGKNVSSIIICSLTRDTSVADNYGGHAYLLSADFHHEIDTMGSRQEFIK
jgi:hypothetical protein